MASLKTFTCGKNSRELEDRKHTFCEFLICLLHLRHKSNLITVSSKIIPHTISMYVHDTIIFLAQQNV